MLCTSPELLLSGEAVLSSLAALQEMLKPSQQHPKILPSAPFGHVVAAHTGELYLEIKRILSRLLSSDFPFQIHLCLLFFFFKLGPEWLFLHYHKGKCWSCFLVFDTFYPFSSILSSPY